MRAARRRRRCEITIKLPPRARRWLDRRALALVQKHPSLCLIDARGSVLAAEARKRQSKKAR